MEPTTNSKTTQVPQIHKPSADPLGHTLLPSHDSEAIYLCHGSAINTALGGEETLFLDRRFLGEIRNLNPDDKYTRKERMRIERLLKKGLSVEFDFGSKGFCIENTALAEKPATPQRFPAIRFGGRETTYFVKVRGPEASFSSALSHHREVTIVTGICLFGAHGAEGRLMDGRKVSLVDGRSVIDSPLEGIETRETFSLYEVESAVRLGSFISSLVSTLGGKRDIKIVLNIPKEEYYNYLLAAKSNGLITPELYALWVRKVDERSEALIRLFRSYLPDNVDITPVNPLSPAEAVLLDGKGTEAEILTGAEQALRQDSLWSSLLDLARPNSLAELNYLGYVYVYLKASLTEEERGGFTLAVENPAEEAIFSAVKRKKLAKRLRDSFPFTLSAIYPLEKMLVPEESIEFPIRVIPPMVCPRTGISTSSAEITKAVPCCPKLYFCGMDISPSLMAQIDCLYGGTER